MDRTSRRPSSMASFMPEAAYASPVSATSSQGRGFPATVGLGISGLEDSYDPMTGYSSQLPFSANSATPNNLTSTENFYILPLDADDFCGRSCFEIYNGIPDPSQSSLGFYDTQPVSLAHGYEPVMEVDAGHGMFPRQMNGMPGIWPNTPLSAPPSPLQSIPTAADRTIESQWNHGIYPEANTSFHPQASAQSIALHPPIPPASQSNPSRPTRAHHTSAMPAIPFPQGVSSNDNTANAASKTTKRGRKPSAEKGCKCPVCGFYFTRRSNCVAHQKKHDPTFHRAIPCDECSKSFGRNADLRRHIDTVHRGIRKHACKWCNRRYTRWENMAKHFAECEERPENERTPSPPSSFVSRSRVLFC
ncbi:uncharacterized protein N7496_007541 [Penicillium cataractarum]|uniref:C2H2-type domain-containing protein n=1 Tax=Penicillium cataractarum TaxID=2100454 RepID=A0A9W9S6A5_9EURO|nr:uncharacterized protein N7496_007541 [Penicillium cataractarum]KAJ5371449.1 hypothetical protein N7496_007541 [Penicillium cataractarum]